MDDNKIKRIYELINTDNVELKGLIDELVTEHYKMLELASIDSLTKVNNRRILNEKNDYDVVIMCDVDNFKTINDTFGHIIGDKVLVLISSILQSMTRENDFVCRYGGDEFAIVLNNCSVIDAVNKLESIKEKLNEEIQELDLNVTISFGITEFEKGKKLISAIEEADKALYSSKRDGKNRISVYKKSLSLN